MNTRTVTTSLLIASVLALGQTTELHATPNFVVAAFATGTQGENNSQDGTYGQYAGDNLSVPYGAGTIAWDGITYDAADGSTGSAYITANFSSANNTALLVSMAPGYNNWYYEGDSQSCPTGVVDGTQYHAIQFDILYDTNSSLSISQFNTGTNWPTDAFANPAAGPNQMTTSYYTKAVNVDFFSGSGGASTQVGTFLIPANADQGWQTVIVPYSDSLPGISAVAGIWFQNAFGAGSTLASNMTASFWIDNLQLIGNTTISAPPTVNNLTKAVAGLNVFNATEGNSYYDRNEVMANANSGLSWVGNPGASYSFTLTGFPQGVPNTSTEAYMFFVPNSLATDGAPDYNETNCLVLEVQSMTNGGAWVSLNIKTNLPGSENFSNVCAFATSNLMGTYTLTFADNDDGTITGPGGSTNFSFTPGTGASFFTETGKQPYNFLLYLGGQANTAAAINQAFVYSNVVVSGVPSGSAVSETFYGESSLANWTTGPTTYHAGVFLAPPGAPYFISWTTPSGGYSLAAASALGPKASWLNVATFSPVGMFGIEQQLISTNDLPAGPDAFFAMVHRSFTQLLVVLDGQTNAPGTATGLTGTPASISLSTNGGIENFTVLAVDANFYPVTTVNDTISVTTTDTGASVPTAVTMINGVATFSLNGPNANPIIFEDQGDWTVTATDNTSTNINPVTSAPVTVTP